MDKLAIYTMLPIQMERVVHKHPLMILVSLWFIFIVWPIGNRGLWAPDEPRYLQVAWEMANAKSYLVPIMNAEIYAEKPPLYFWLTIAASKIFPWETASRWVSAFASLGILLLTYSLGQFSGDRQTGLTAALILMTFVLFTLLMSTGNIDTTLTFLTTLSYFLYLRWETDKQAVFLICAYLACGIAILAKGPVGLVLPWLSYAVWEAVKKVRHEDAAFKHLIWGPLLAGAIAGAWVVPACTAGGQEYTQIILFKQQFGRSVDSWSHARPWYDYLILFPLNTLPWFVVLPAALPELKKLIRAKHRWIFFYMLWFGTIFIFFSLISGKRERYLLPCFPAFSLLLSHAITCWSEHRQGSRSIKITGMLVMAGACGLLLFPFTLPWLKNKVPQLGIFPVDPADWRLWFMAVLAIAAVGMLWQVTKIAKHNHHHLAVNLLAVAFLLVAGAAQIYYIPYIDPVKSARPVAEKIKALLPQEGTLVFYNRRFDNGWNFYLDRAKIPVITDEEIKQAQPQVDMILLREKHLESLKAVLDMDRYQIAAVEPVGSKRFVLLKKVSGCRSAVHEITHRQGNILRAHPYFARS
jgi:4-amino-4-deoxy-L-arabinose transferase-like glycosyltransferase